MIPALLLSLTGAGATCRAQTCTPQWLNGQIPALNGPAYAMTMWDPDGPGPRPPALVVGGSFTLAGTVPVTNLALWDGVAWSNLGGGVSGDLHGAAAVNALAALPNGDLIVGGAFDNAGAGAGTVAASCIARFNGSSWSAMQQGTWRLVDTVRSMTVRPNGDLIVVGGLFLNLDNTITGPLVRWSDASPRWSDLSSPLPNIASIRTALALQNGDVVIGGAPNSSDPNSSAAWRWRASDSTWQNFGTGVRGTDPFNQVFSILELANSDIVFAGNFTSASGLTVASIARWNGTQFNALGTGITYPSQPFQLAVRALAQMPNGDIVAGGQFDTAGGNPGGRVARWDGATWTRLPQGAGDIVWSLLRSQQHELIVGGQYTFAGGSFANKRIARYTDLPSPWIATQPSPVTAAAGASVALSATAAIGFTNVSVQWKRNGTDISNGPGGASLGGGIVSGASNPLPSPTTGASSSLTITNAQPSDSGLYTAVFSNACGDVTSLFVSVQVTGSSCNPADIACDNGDPLASNPGCTNSSTGPNEGDYNAFFSADGFFFQAAQGPAGIGGTCDIACDNGDPLAGNPGCTNNGVNEGDYNCFFNNLFLPCA